MDSNVNTEKSREPVENFSVKYRAYNLGSFLAFGNGHLLGGPLHFGYCSRRGNKLEVQAGHTEQSSRTFEWVDLQSSLCDTRSTAPSRIAWTSVSLFLLPVTNTGHGIESMK